MSRSNLILTADVLLETDVIQLAAEFILSCLDCYTYFIECESTNVLELVFSYQNVVVVGYSKVPIGWYEGQSITTSANHISRDALHRGVMTCPSCDDFHVFIPVVQKLDYEKKIRIFLSYLCKPIFPWMLVLHMHRFSHICLYNH